MFFYKQLIIISNLIRKRVLFSKMLIGYERVCLLNACIFLSSGEKHLNMIHRQFC